MKKILCAMIATLLLFTAVPALGDAVVVDAPLEVEALVVLSPTTGLPLVGEYRPMVVQISNEPDARPQWNFSKADVVYETVLYKGGYTRYTAVFNDEIPHKVGPVRSTRMLNVDLYRIWGGAFVHHGAQSSPGSDAYSYVKKLDIGPRYDGMTNSCFKRDKHYKAPNNSYTHLDEIIDDEPFTVEPVKHFAFSDELHPGGEKQFNFTINYRKSYKASYKFDEATMLYNRYYNDKVQNDGEDKTPITCSNVIIMKIEQTWLGGSSERPAMKMTGEGDCEYFVGGNRYMGKWVRPTLDDIPLYLDAEGNEMTFQTGKTFVQIIDTDKEVQLDDE